MRRFLAAPRQGGFTIIEVMIVLAVSGMLFISAAVMISGRQNQTAFDQAIQQVQSQVQQTLNEVSTGYYPNKSDFSCTAGAQPSLSAIASNQGTNTGCIFLGKAIQFSISGTDPERFAVYTIAGLQNIGTCATESVCLGNAKPMVVAPSVLHSASGYPDNSTEEQLQHGLRVVRAWYKNGGADVEIGGIAFVNSLLQAGSSSIVSGTGSVNIVALDGTSLGVAKDVMADTMNSDGGNKIAAGTVNPSGGIFVCFESGGTQDYAILQIGGDSRDLAVNLTTKDKGGPTCTYP